MMSTCNPLLYFRWNGSATVTSYGYLKCRGLYFGPKTIFIPPPPSENDIFSPFRDISFSTPIMAFLS
jgi:hypothetical protein